MSIFYNDFYEKKRGKSHGDFSFKWPILKKNVPIKNGQKVLDFGCGTGIIINKLNKLFSNCKFTGVDVSETAIKIAKKKNPLTKFWVVEDGNKFPFKSFSFDTILAADVIEHVYNTESTVLEMARVLKKGGKIMITTPYYGFVKNLLIVTFGFDLILDPTGPHIRFFTKKSLSNLLKKSGLKIIKFGYFGRFYPVSRSMYVIAQK